ncbi:hypothetical protein FIA58_002585 [Flavobacterium jejuense]|uniref:Outer membrane protein beta-barrel domain-containing protein n=1 Tax=Flavobacterium jejuense TaxID=1544455 RepID=A0ABX0IQZ9_9FLAO|nr:hypothetical protein [Flavobacterium jejuense]NHN24551.1 hypothetical protein [Flavobacterium jejuense]
MKTTTFILYFLFFGIIGYSQVETKVIIVDLSKPHIKSVLICKDSSGEVANPPCDNVDSSKWLSVQSKDMISIKLINGNPLKFDYKIDTKNIIFYNDNVDNNLNQIISEIERLSIAPSIAYAVPMGTIQNIVDTNNRLFISINELNIEVDTFYETLKQKKVLTEEDYIDRSVELLKESKNILKETYENDNELQSFVKDPNYNDVKKVAIANKNMAAKSVDNIINKLYSINLDSYTLPIDIQGQNIDAIEFKLKRFDKETKEEDINFASKPYNIWIKGGLKIDVSAGLFFSSLYDYEFDKRDDLSTSGNKIITLKNKGEYDLAFGSMINTYVRMNSWVVPTLNFGAALTQNEKLQVLFGGGLILGKQERIILTAGISMGKVERIADSYSVGESYNLGDSGTIPTQSEFKFGNFFGITYNLSKVKKISLDKGIE